MRDPIDDVSMYASGAQYAAWCALSAYNCCAEWVCIQAEALPKSNQEAVEQPTKEVEPVISSVENVKALLQSAVDSLNALKEASEPDSSSSPMAGVSSREAPSVTGGEADSNPGP